MKGPGKSLDICSQDLSHDVTPPHLSHSESEDLRGAGPFVPGLCQFNPLKECYVPGLPWARPDEALSLGAHSEFRRRDRMLPMVVLAMAIAAIHQVYQCKTSRHPPNSSVMCIL